MLRSILHTSVQRELSWPAFPSVSYITGKSEFVAACAESPSNFLHIIPRDSIGYLVDRTILTSLCRLYFVIYTGRARARVGGLGRH